MAASRADRKQRRVRGASLLPSRSAGKPIAKSKTASRKIRNKSMAFFGDPRSGTRTTNPALLSQTQELLASTAPRPLAASQRDGRHRRIGCCASPAARAVSAALSPREGENRAAKYCADAPMSAGRTPSEPGAAFHRRTSGLPAASHCRMYPACGSASRWSGNARHERHARIDAARRCYASAGSERNGVIARPAHSAYTPALSVPCPGSRSG